VSSILSKALFLSPQVVNELESSSMLRVAYKISDEAVTSLKEELKVEDDAEKVEEDTEEIESASEEIRLVCFFPFHNQHQRFNLVYCGPKKFWSFQYFIGSQKILCTAAVYCYIWTLECLTHYVP
jgi:hypothetical protein